MEKLSTLLVKGLLWVLLFSPSGLILAQFEFYQKIVSDRESRAEFGTSISLQNSYMVIGASRENIAAGAAYVYQKDANGNWEFTQKLTADDASEMSEFGGGMYLSPNYLAVAAGRANLEGAEFAGAIYVFRNLDGNWNQAYKITASDYSEFALLGVNPTSIDGENTLLVAGAPGINNWNGGVYVFELGENNWTEIQKINPPDGSNNGNFGISVAISGNYLVIGASGETNGQGSAYVFEREGNQWNFVQKLIASTPVNNAYFGTSVDVSGDELVVGAYAEGNPGTEIASAYVFKRMENGTWQETQKLTGDFTSEDSFYGWDVQMTSSNLWVSAPNVWGEEAGKIYHYQKLENGQWEEIQQILPTEDMARDSFGWSMDFNEGFLAVGAVRDDFDQNGENELQDAGSAFVFYHENLKVEDLNTTDNWVKVYPNPVKNILHIDSSEKIKSAELYEATGRLIISSSEKSIEISTLPKGVYFLNITNFSGRISSHKLIKN